MEITQYTSELEQFRSELYQNLNKRADTLMELVDAMSSNPSAQSVVEYSLSECFRRSYSTIFKAIDEMEVGPMLLPALLAPYLPKPRLRPYWLLMVDVTSQPRRYAQTLGDRGMVYEASIVKKNKPVTIGHQYSTVSLGVEAEANVSTSWVLPLLNRRVATEQDKELVGGEQVDALLQDAKLPFGQDLSVEVADSSYSKAAYLHSHRKHDNLVTVVRVRGNRTFYQQPNAAAESGAGHPTWFGEPFALSNPATWPAADETESHGETSRRGKVYRIEVQSWNNMLMRGKRQPKPLPMHEHPFTLVRIVRYHAEGQLACKRPLWLIVMGKRRHQLNLAQIYAAYRGRFNIEHFFRFGKQQLLMTAFQTPEVTREEKWWQLTHIAYAQLWLARHVAHATPRPWERNLPAIKHRQISPTLVQRDFARIIRQLGTPAQPPKPRGISPGRLPGTHLTPRLRQNVVVKGVSPPSTA